MITASPIARVSLFQSLAVPDVAFRVLGVELQTVLSTITVPVDNKSPASAGYRAAILRIPVMADRHSI
jgi:hypothetical protein